MNTATIDIQGNAISALVEEFGTPLFVYDADVLERTYHELRDVLPVGADIFYSLKANPNVSVCAMLNSLGTGAEVSSYTELVTALRAGVAPRDVIFLGPGKDEQELAACIEAGIHAIVCESLDELDLLDSLLATAGRNEFPVLMRINPAFGSKGSGLAMGGKPRQFGIDEVELRDSKSRLAALQNIRVKGVHAYMGTRFLNHEDVVHNTRQILATAEDLAGVLGFPLETVDFGGGLGVAYFDNENDVELAALGTGLTDVLSTFSARNPRCRMIMELGRFLTAVAGTYIVRARYVKDSMGEKFVVADGGTNHHMAAVGVGSFVKRNFPIRHLSNTGALRPYTVTGPLCTPNDVVGKKVQLPEVRPGDLLAVERSGAYGPTASPGLFLSHGFPAEVLVHGGQAHLVRERDSVEDLLAKQHLVDFHPAF
ncbi:diaminopimelate decarboxylase [Actinopolyspora erythraea]|uniref:Diaminopimelate decarboxylase n=1 Tax=Actinopolyspora erythraea TaxID=414996 RepID=A0A099D3A6_9ACTN|nr:diaminopimelate decarboxylase [Actinopolyspora erythraea]ASU79162.1 diaminopimelate decarboxylase [Actinopolyspora erythraea]KGI80658.1 diaminopimelate decarboxylase [Actinopolyspora erythraea]